jgi:hypothetical protein
MIISREFPKTRKMINISFAKKEKKSIGLKDESDADCNDSG